MNGLRNTKNVKTIMAGVMAALCFVATYLIKVPTPTNGYVHLGDGFVLLSGIVLGPVYGALAAAIGSMLTDLLAGYAQYAIATFFIKGLLAFVSGLIFMKSFDKKNSKTLYSVIAGVIGMVIMCGGYWLFEALFMGYGLLPALVGVPANMAQGIVGTVVAVALTPTFVKIPVVRELKK